MSTLSILGSGWLGLPLARHFKQAGYNINISTRHVERIGELTAFDLSPYIIDIDHLTPIVNDFLQTNILIINITSKNLDGFKDLISHILSSPVKEVLFISSTSVYQNLNREVTEDEAAEDPQHPLYQIENLFRNTSAFDTTIIRFGGLIDNRRHPGHFFRNGKVVPQANAPVNLIHRDDCIDIIDAIINQHSWGEVFNACADTHPSKREFYTHARELLDMPPPDFDDSAEPAFKIISNNKLKQQLNYQFIYPDLLKINF